MKYVIPFFYTHKYNRKGIEGWAYFFEYYIALFVLVLLYTQNMLDLILLFLSLTAYSFIYEIGYIENNVFAIKLDAKPTLRHSELECSFIEKNMMKITMFRYIMAAILIIIMSQLTNVSLFVFLLMVTRVVFYLYNMQFRQGVVHRLLFVGLRFLRYFTPIFFLGINALLFVLPVVMVNFINNYAWYDRSSLHLPRFFGTKVFDSVSYLCFYLYFVYVLDLDTISYIFLYMAVMKMILFVAVLVQKRLHKYV